MVLLVIDSVEGLDNYQIIFLFFVFFDHLLHWGKVLLVRKIDMIEKGALSWQEATGHFETLGVPVL